MDEREILIQALHTVLERASTDEIRTVYYFCINMI